MTPRQVTSRRPPGYFEGAPSTFVALAFFAVIALVGLGLGFTRPLLREAPLSGAFDQGGTFSYSATPKSPTPVYPSGSVQTGDPIYPSLVNDVVLRFSYRFSSAMPHEVKGTIELKALLLSQSNTWQQLTVIKAPEPFEGDTASVVSSLPLQGLYGLIDTVSAQSGVTGAAYLADIQPVVRITGDVGGRAIHESFAPVLPFTVAPTVITLNDAVAAAPPGATYVAPSATSELAATLHPSQSGSVDHLVTNVISIVKYDVDIDLLRVIGMIFAGLAVALMIAHDVLRRRRTVRSEEEQIARRLHCVVVPVTGLGGSDPERIDVAGFSNLAALAQYLERPILYEANGDERTFAVDDEHHRYVFRTRPDGPVAVGTKRSKTESVRPPSADPSPYRQHRRSWRANAARGTVGVVVLLAVSATLAVSFTATTTVPTSRAGTSAHVLAIPQLQPAGCNSLALTALVQGSGTFSNSRSNVLILGGTGSDTITDTGTGNCIVAGGGTNSVTGTSSDICISGPTLNIAAACPVANGVTATPSEVGSGSYSGQDLLLVANSSSMTAMTVTIVVKQTTGVTYSSESNGFAGGYVTQNSTTSGGVITYTTTLNSGKTISAGGSATVYAQFSGTGSARSYSGDTWSITSTSNGIVSTLNGVF